MCWVRLPKILLQLNASASLAAHSGAPGPESMKPLSGLDRAKYDDQQAISLMGRMIAR